MLGASYVPGHVLSPFEPSEVGVPFLPFAHEETEAQKSDTSSEATQLGVVELGLEPGQLGSRLGLCSLWLSLLWTQLRGNPSQGEPQLVPDPVWGSGSRCFTRPRGVSHGTEVETETHRGLVLCPDHTGREWQSPGFEVAKPTIFLPPRGKGAMN